MQKGLGGLRGRWAALGALAGLFLGASAVSPAPLSPPGDLVASALHGQRIDLQWSGAEGALGYRVSRECPVGDEAGYCELAKLPGDRRSYRDDSAHAATRYRYRVEALSGPASNEAFAEATTPSPTSLPAAQPPIYFEPQGVWSQGAPASLREIKRLHIRHNLASRRDLRILLDASNSRSLVSRLHEAGFGVRTDKSYSGQPKKGIAEIYFYDLKRGLPEAPLPAAIEAFDRMGEEGYVLVAEATGNHSLRIVVGAQTPKGLFRGGMTVQRLLLGEDLMSRRVEIEPVIVLDYPDHPNRGAGPSWAPMNANHSFVPEPALDMLDSLARSGATEVDWMASAPAQEEFHWRTTGARAAALVQLAARERFMDVSYFMGGVQFGHGTKGPPEVADSRMSMDQVPFSDGLGVVAEPFAWIETSPGRWQALAERRGTLHGRNTAPDGGPWLAKPCSPGGWKHDPRTGRPGPARMSWRLGGKARHCELAESLDVSQAFSPGGFFLSAWLKASADAAGVEGELRLEIDTAEGTREYTVSLPASLPAKAWTQLTLAIPDFKPPAPVRAARLVIRASLASGNLWVDDFMLYEWQREIFPFGSLTTPDSWSIDSKPGGLVIDPSTGRRDSKSFRVRLPLTLGKGQGARLAGRVQEIRLEEGRYILGAWIRAEDRGAGSSPNSGKKKKRKPFETKLDISLKFYAGAPLRGVATGGRLAAEYLNFPGSVRPGPDAWFYHTHIFDVSEEMAAKTRSVAIQVRVFQSQSPGTLWIDDIHLRRLDGDLRNLMGAVQAPILRDPSGKRYVEGQDYEVCQVGSRGTRCKPPGNYATLLEGGLTEAYDEDRPPFEIRWIRRKPPEQKRLSISYDIKAQYSRAGRSSMSWDGQVVRSGVLNFCDIDAVALGIDLEEIFGRYLDGYEIENFPERGETYTFRADSVTWGVSEVRGINRSIACLGEDGKPARSNAALFAEVVNKAAGIAKRKHPDVRFWLWDDMLNPFHNGGNSDYQRRYGGVAGASACSMAPASLPLLCADEVGNVPKPIIENQDRWKEGIIMHPWKYGPTALRPMVATASWYQHLSVTSQVLAGASPINVDDWAAVAHTFGDIQGVVGTIYKAHLYGGRSGLLPALQKFWNHDWKLLYLRDNETSASSHYVVPWPIAPELSLRNAREDFGGACAAFAFTFPGNSDGGICLDPPPAKPKVALGPIPVRAGTKYRVDFLARSGGRGSSAASATPPKVRVRWSGGDSTGSLPARMIYQSRDFRDSDGFDRFRVEVEAPPGAKSMEVELEFGASGPKSAVDDIAIFEATEPCFNACEASSP